MSLYGKNSTHYDSHNINPVNPYYVCWIIVKNPLSYHEKQNLLIVYPIQSP